MNEKSLQKDLRLAGIELTDAQSQKLWRFHERLRRENPRLNLTRIHSYAAMVRKHYVDCLIVIKFLRNVPGFFDSPRTLLDFGSGAGLPGIPLAIALPEFEFILNESRANRAEFLQACVEDCGLRNVTVLGKRLAESDGVKADAVVLRAVGAMKPVLLKTAFAIRSGGWILFLKGPNCDEEIHEMEQFGQAVKLVLDQEYRLPDSDDRRRLVVFRIDAPDDVMRHKSRTPPGVEVIASRDNERYKTLLAVQQSRGIKKHGITVVSGRRLVKEVLEDHSGKIEALVVNRGFWEGDEEPPAGVPVWTFENDLFRELDSSGTGTALAVARVDEIPAWDGLKTEGLTVVLPFQDPENLGAAVRTANAFGASLILLSQEAANPFLPRAIRSSALASFCGVIRRGPTLEKIGELLASEEGIIALSGEGDASLFEIVMHRTTVVVAGLEGPGLPDSFPGRRVAIPIAASVESLNAGAAL